jgi:hypothetical protein
MRNRSSWITASAGVAVLAGALAAAAGVYTEEQLQLADRLGAAVALSRICTGTVPTTAVVSALEAGGLTQGDVLGDTPIHQRMQGGAAAVLAGSNRKRDGGLSQAEIVKAACEAYRATFGPDGRAHRRHAAIGRVPVHAVRAAASGYSAAIGAGPLPSCEAARRPFSVKVNWRLISSAPIMPVAPSSSMAATNSSVLTRWRNFLEMISQSNVCPGRISGSFCLIASRISVWVASVSANLAIA